MHELSIMKQVTKTALEIRERENFQKIRTITLLVGEGRNFVQEWVQDYFDMLAEGSPIAGTRILLETVPITCKCTNCGEIYRKSFHEENETVCPVCKGSDYELCTGYELIIKNMEVITGEEEQ